MNITELLIPEHMLASNSTSIKSNNLNETNRKIVEKDFKKKSIHDDELMNLWKLALEKAGFKTKLTSDRNSLTDAILSPIRSSKFMNEIPVHIKVIGRHMNGSFRCHIGTSKASRPIQSIELCRQMRLLAVFFRTENAKSQLISPEFIFFPTWLLHLFRYTQYESTPGRTDVRFLENANMAKEDHIYRLNYVLNTLFRFNIHDFDPRKMRSAIELSNFLFDVAGLDYKNLPRPIFFNELSYHYSQQPIMYSALLLLLHSPRPTKFKPMCFNCNAKPASRRRLCVACYRYQLKHGQPRPLRLIVANRPGPRMSTTTTAANNKNSTDSQEKSIHKSNLPMVFYSPKSSTPRTQKYCANCKVTETHQWYRNLCGHGNWCETCKSYYLRHTKVRPPELFVKAAKRKVDVRSLVNWNTWSWDDIPTETVEAATAAILSDNFMISTTSMNTINSPTSSITSSSSSSSFSSYPTTPPFQYYDSQRRTSLYSTSSSSSLW